MLFFLGRYSKSTPEFSHAPAADHVIPYSSKGVNQRQLISGIADLFFAKKQFSLNKKGIVYLQKDIQFRIAGILVALFSEVSLKRSVT